MIGGIDGRGLSIPRGGPIPPRGERYPGIHAIEVYVPRHCVQADALEVEHDCKGKYTDGLQMQQWGACDEDEDVVSMARTAVRRLVEKQGLAWEDIGMLNVGTESLLDRSKSIKSHLMDLFPPDVVGVEARNPSPSRILAPLQTPNPVPWPQTPPDPRPESPAPTPTPRSSTSRASTTTTPATAAPPRSSRARTGSAATRGMAGGPSSCAPTSPTRRRSTPS